MSGMMFTMCLTFFIVTVRIARHVLWCFEEMVLLMLMGNLVPLLLMLSVRLVYSKQHLYKSSFLF